MPNRIFYYMIVLLMTACASTHPGNIGESISPQAKLPLKISAESIDAKKNESFQLIDLTLENTSDAWLKINRTQVLIGDPAESKLSVVLGSDLKDWAQAVSFKQKQDQHNTEMAQMGLLGVGTAAALMGGYRGDSGLATAGAAVAVGTYGWVLTDAISSSINEAQRSEKIPDNHLYHSASIPSKMFLRRWVLINKPVGQVLNKLVIEFETVEGEKDTYAINL